MKILKISLIGFLLFLLGMSCTHSRSVEDADNVEKADTTSNYYADQEDIILPGFRSKISGNDFTFRYDRPFIGLKEAMIIRGSDNSKEMEWETASVPTDPDAEFVTFIWPANIFGDDIPMELDVNSDSRIAFRLSDKRSWKEEKESGVSLAFNETYTAGEDDLYGFMLLRIPIDQVTPGEPLKLKVSTDGMTPDDKFMTFKKSVEQGFTVDSDVALLEQDADKKQPLLVNLFYFGEPGEGQFFLDNKLEHEFEGNFGLNRFKINLPEITEKKKIDGKIKLNDFESEEDVDLQPVRKWKMNFVQNTHSDIGYTRPQTEILGHLLRHIDHVLDYCDATDDFPEDAQFRWTTEATWAVKEYLRSRPPEQVERFIQRVKEGRIEVSGMFFNFDELPDEQSLAQSLAPIDTIREHGIEVKSAMQNDVNGIAWTFNDYFNSLGISYLSMATHGHKARVAFDLPTAFWWESPSGNKMLAFRGEHYHKGNFEFHISRQNFDYFEEHILDYLVEMDEKDYPYDNLMIQHSGYLTDNSPPSIRPAEMIRKWNEKYEWPKLRMAVLSEFFEEVEEKYADDLPTYRGAWPDWWTDGFGSGAREVAATRQGHVDLISAQNGLSMAKMAGSEIPNKISDRIDLTNESLLFYGEHTFGSHASISDPNGKETLEMRRLKESYGWEASRRASMVQEEALGLLQSQVKGIDALSLAVFNTLPNSRSGYVELFIDHERVPQGSKIRLIDPDGDEHPAQILRHIHGGSYWAIWADDIPAFGFKQFEIEIEEKKEESQFSDSSESYENEWYRLEIDKKKGAVKSLYDKELEEELIDKEADWKLGEFVHEQLANRNELDQFYLESYKRSSLDSVTFEGYREGPVWNSLHFTGSTETAQGDNGFGLEVRIYNTAKRIDFAYRLNKKRNTNPESIYIALPFKLEEAEIFADVPGGTIQAGVDQIPGSSNDWNTIQNFASIRNNDAQIVVGSHEAPLMQFGNINTGRFEKEAKPETTHIFGWPMNNYWTTNFNADQRGDFHWTYYITSVANDALSTATNFGWHNRIPLLPRIIPADNADSESSRQNSIMSEFPSNVLLVNSEPEERGVLLHLRETQGESAEFSPELRNGEATQFIETDVNGNSLSGRPSESIQLEPYEKKFIRLIW